MVRVGGGLRGRATSWPPTLSPSYYRTHAKDMRLKCPCMSLTSQASQIRPLHRRRIVEAIHLRSMVHTAMRGRTGQAVV
jgi:hypothetical protein